VISLKDEEDSMSGPIVRTGTNPKFWKNWDNIFGDKAAAGGKSAGSGSTKAAAGKTAKKAVKKAAKKAAKKATKKK
jgi:hypothetical protein